MLNKVIKHDVTIKIGVIGKSEHWELRKKINFSFIPNEKHVFEFGLNYRLQVDEIIINCGNAVPEIEIILNDLEYKHGYNSDEVLYDFQNKFGFNSYECAMQMTKRLADKSTQ